ncbi:DUF2567 domain-containing protein [Tsukamurella pulmonis]|uniref:DUF2567 domain-containing protein n=1 Tax=Tsukamurella pulmonis TaxID=47312 RepID=A0A1H1EM18_9ACTN|nr:DUF2567 domain-containing protein [Tsukamurella pulmonis]RDH11917.1 DUF2567 domain-containing protein [Tsukamurella pulmonis]SDQ89821.1 Protein of unknown function [Tsukamurella pulmonis]SUP20713.1 Uncharacterised protein [Tsukamurella pulmonis]
MPTHTPTRSASHVVVPLVVGAVLGAAAALVWGTTAPGVRGVVLDTGQPVLRTDQFDNFFIATVLFVTVSAVGGLLTALGLFRGARRTPRGVALTLGAATLGVLIAVLLGQAVVNARFTGPGAPGLDFTAAPSIRLEGANVFALADHSGGTLGDLASWVLVLVWPGITALVCVVLALLGRLPDDEPAHAPSGAQVEAPPVRTPSS